MFSHLLRCMHKYSQFASVYIYVTSPCVQVGYIMSSKKIAIDHCMLVYYICTGKWTCVYLDRRQSTPHSKK